MKSIGKLAGYLLLACNALFTGMLLLAAYSPYIHPVKHPVLSCMGLLFPVFLIMNVIFLALWLVIRPKFAVFPLLVLLLCYPQIRTYMPLNFSDKNVPEESFKVLSYNLMIFDGHKKEDGKNNILSYLSNSGADIICMQEYVASGNRKFLTQADIDKELSDYPYKSIHKVGKGASNGLACYSKYPILSSRMLKYESGYNGSVAYEIKMGNDTVLVINNHLESNKLTKEDKAVCESSLKAPEAEKVKSGARQLITKLAEAMAIRSRQAEVIAAEIAATRHAYVIVCGDFNDTPISYTHRIIAQDLDDAFVESGQGLGISYNQNRFYFRIDNILVSRNMKTYRCTVDRTIDDSDHYPIWCYINKR